MERSAAVLLYVRFFDYIQGVQIALLQHNSLYESIASSLHRAQKKALGKTLVGRELYMSARDACDQLVHRIQSKLLQVIGERRRLWIGGHDGVVRMSSPGQGRLQRKSSEGDFLRVKLFHWNVI